jgi:hypothetical protein
MYGVVFDLEYKKYGMMKYIAWMVLSRAILGV